MQTPMTQKEFYESTEIVFGVQLPKPMVNILPNMYPNGKFSEQRWLNILSKNILLNIAAAAGLRRASSSNPGWFYSD